MGQRGLIDRGRQRGWDLTHIGIWNTRASISDHWHYVAEAGNRGADTIIFEPWRNRPNQRSELCQCQQRRAAGRDSDHGRVTRSIENSLASARGYSEQYPG